MSSSSSESDLTQASINEDLMSNIENIIAGLDRIVEGLNRKLKDNSIELLIIESQMIDLRENELRKKAERGSLEENIKATIASRDQCISTLNSLGGEGPAVDDGTHLNRIANFLRSEGNEPKTIQEIVKGTGISRSSISAVLYRTHKDKFVKIEGTGESRSQAWRLASYEPVKPAILVPGGRPNFIPPATANPSSAKNAASNQSAATNPGCATDEQLLKLRELKNKLLARKGLGGPETMMSRTFWKSELTPYGVTTATALTVHQAYDLIRKISAELGI